MNRKFVIGDIHGEYERLKEVLKLSNFDYENDELISLGDICDRGENSFGVVEELLKIKKLIAIKGNHDDLFLQWIEFGYTIHRMPDHGFHQCLNSYIKHSPSYKGDDKYLDIVPDSHVKFYKGQILHYTDQKNRFFCHAGFNLNKKLDKQEKSDFYWDRNLFHRAWHAGHDIKKLPDVNNFDRIFIGHTPTILYNKINVPIYKAQIVNVDTGACFIGGKLSLIDITDDENHVLYQA